MRVFILEDEIDREPRIAITRILRAHKLTIAKSKDEAVKKYRPPYDLLILDHDMRGFLDPSSYPNCGYQFVKWLVAIQLPPKPEVWLHSQNAYGRLEMAKLLQAHDFTVRQMPFGPAYLELLRLRFT